MDLFSGQHKKKIQIVVISSIAYRQSMTRYSSELIKDKVKNSKYEIIINIHAEVQESL